MRDEVEAVVAGDAVALDDLREQVRLEKTGVKVSRICLGMMSYGDPAVRPWALDEDAAEPIRPRPHGLPPNS